MWCRSWPRSPLPWWLLRCRRDRSLRARWPARQSRDTKPLVWGRARAMSRGRETRPGRLADCRRRRRKDRATGKACRRCRHRRSRWRQPKDKPKGRDNRQSREPRIGQASRANMGRLPGSLLDHQPIAQRRLAPPRSARTNRLELRVRRPNMAKPCPGCLRPDSSKVDNPLSRSRRRGSVSRRSVRFRRSRNRNRGQGAMRPADNGLRKDLSRAKRRCLSRGRPREDPCSAGRMDQCLCHCRRRPRSVRRGRGRLIQADRVRR